jgi:hypothetical protein
MPWVTIEEYRNQKSILGLPISIKKLQAQSRTWLEKSRTKAK